MASQPPVGGVAPYPPLQQVPSQPYDLPTKPGPDPSYGPQPPVDSGYRPTGNPELYRPADPSYPPPPGINGVSYPPPPGVNHPKYGPPPSINGPGYPPAPQS